MTDIDYRDCVFPELGSVYVNEDLKMIFVIGYGDLEIYHSVDHSVTTLRMLILYSPHKKRCYLYCIELDMMLTVVYDVLKGVKQLVCSVCAFLILNCKDDNLIDLSDLVQRYELKDFRILYDHVVNVSQEKHFKIFSHDKKHTRFVHMIMGQQECFRVNRCHLYLLKPQIKELIETE